MPQSGEAGSGWLHLLLDNALALTILVIFLVAAIGAVVRIRRRDKCLKLLHDHHVTFLARSGAVMWGDLVVYSQGLELVFDAPHRTLRGHLKSSQLLYQAELSQCLGLVRLDLALSEDERTNRARQVRRSYQPGVLRRSARATRNAFETMRDAVSKAITALIDSLARSRGAAELSKKENPDLARTLVGEGQVYDPMLERHVGRPVVLRIDDPDLDAPPFEVSGYLVDYTEDWIAVFNAAHAPLETEVLGVSGDVERPDLEVALSATSVRITNPGTDLLVVKTARIGHRLRDLAVALLPGSRLELARGNAAQVELTLGRTRTFDVVCPRAIATVYYGSDAVPADRHPHDGLAPLGEQEEEAETGS